MEARNTIHHNRQKCPIGLIFLISIVFQAIVLLFPSDNRTLTVSEGNYKEKVTLQAAADIATENAAPESHQHEISNEKISLHLIGERHSGTKWMSNHLQSCFPDIHFDNNLFRWKHWFQDETLPDKHNGTRFVVVAQFRNPYSWVESMRALPYHAPEHFHLTFSDFISRAWTMKRTGPDEQYDMEGLQQSRMKEVWCNSALFHPFDVVPCLANRTVFSSKGILTKALYEMKVDGSGQPYQSILDLRRDKIKNFLDVKHFRRVNAFYPVLYEDLKKLGSGNLVKALEFELGIPARCHFIAGNSGFRDKEIPESFKQSIDKQLDWTQEKRIGYYPRAKN